jgi:formylglycine-generating enzyme required for sulfatase activity
MVMVYVPAGEFLMGSNKLKDSMANDDELPQHTIYLDAFSGLTRLW